MKVRGEAYVYHRLRYTLDGRLRRPTFASLEEARKEATRIAQKIHNGNARASSLTEQDCASFSRARQILADAGITKPLELVVAEYCEMTRARVVDPKFSTPFKDVVTSFIEHKERDGTRWRYRAELMQRLRFLEKHINSPLIELKAEGLTEILDDLQRKRGWSNRSRNHYRAALSNLASFAQGRFVPREWAELSHVEKFKERDGQIVIWEVAEAAKLFKTAEKKMPRIIPALVIMFFSGSRHSETTGTPQDNVPPLDWAEMDLEAGSGFLVEGKVRAAGNRITHLPANALEWLRLYKKKSGPLCPFKNLNNQIQELSDLAKIEWRQNAARRSYISYRLALTKNLPLVSEETGTSIVTLQRRYRRPIPLTDAQEYFNILPSVRDSGSQKVAKTAKAKASDESAKHEGNA